MTRLIILFFLLFQIQDVQSQDWDWNQQLSSFSNIERVFPTPDGKWVIIGHFQKTSNNILLKELFHYIAIIDSTGTVWGKEDKGRIYHVDQLNDSTLVIAKQHFYPNDPTYEYGEYSIKDNKLEEVISTNLYFGFGDFGDVTNGEFVFLGNEYIRFFNWDNPPGPFSRWWFFGSNLKDFIILGDDYYLSAGKHLINGEEFGLVKFYATTLDSIDTQWTALPDINIQEVYQLSDGNIIAMSSNHIYKLDANLESIAEQEFSFLQNKIDQTSDGNSIFIVSKHENERPEFYEVNSDLQLVQSLPFGHERVFPKNIEVKNNSIGIGADVLPSLPYDAPSTFYLKVFQKDSLLEESSINIKMENVSIGGYETYNDSYLCHFQRSLKLKNIKFEIKNEGTEVVNEFFINYFKSGIDCNVRINTASLPRRIVSSDKFFNLNLQPGESTTLQIPELRLPVFIPNSDPNNPTYNFCFWVSAINHTLDKDITDEPLDVGIWEQPFLLTPNPINDFLQISFTAATLDPYELRIYNSLGQLIYEEDILTLSLSHEVDLTKLLSGNYFIHFSSGENVFINKFIKH